MRARSPWFGPKRFGIGISPSSWQGWVSTGIFVALLVPIVRVPGHGVLKAGALVVLTLALILIMVRTYGPRQN